ncbi:MAG: serine hydrolase, partial [Pseudomonadales bacterium]
VRLSSTRFGGPGRRVCIFVRDYRQPGEAGRGKTMSVSRFRRLATIAGLVFALGYPPGGVAQTGSWLTAEASDPRVMGWMEGFPPPPDKLITQPDSNYFSFPKLRWTVCHLREFLPTGQVSRGIGAPAPLEYALDEPAIDALTFNVLGSDEEMTWKASLSANYTDGILIMHQGKIVYERYSGCLDETGQHGAMSMTKSLTGLLAEILVVEGALDDTALVSSIVPELRPSAFGNATVRQVMDMTTGLSYSEDYADPDADIWKYSMAASPLPKPSGYSGPEGYFEYLQTVQPEGEHGESFHYKTINTDALGWIISRVSGEKVTDLLSERLWRRMGAEQDGYMTVDGKGTPFAGGGLSAGLRDLGRVGLLMLNEGEINGQRLFPAQVVANIRSGGSRSAFARAGYATMEGGSYRSMWWLFHDEDQAFAARGVHGQTVYVDPTARMVIVRLASFPSAANANIDPTSLPAYRAVAAYLKSKATQDAG